MVAYPILLYVKDMDFFKNIYLIFLVKRLLRIKSIIRLHCDFSVNQEALHYSVQRYCVSPSDNVDSINNCADAVQLCYIFTDYTAMIFV